MLKRTSLLLPMFMLGCASQTPEIDIYQELPQNKYKSLHFNTVYNFYLSKIAINSDVVEKFIHSNKDLDKKFLSYKEKKLPTTDIENEAKNRIFEIKNSYGKEQLYYAFTKLDVSDYTYSTELSGYAVEKDDYLGIILKDQNENYYITCGKKACGLDHSLGYIQSKVKMNFTDWYIPMDIETAKSVAESGDFNSEIISLIVFRFDECSEGKKGEYVYSGYRNEQIITCSSTIEEMYMYPRAVLHKEDFPILSFKKR